MKTWLWRPFSRLAGPSALLIGLAAMLATAVAGMLTGIHPDGMLDLHIRGPAPLQVLLAQTAIDWLMPALALLITGHWLSSRRYRIVDLLGTQALARWPLLPAVLLIGLPPYRIALQRALNTLLLGPAGASIDLLVAMLLGLFPLIFIAWMIWLMLHSYMLVFNLKGSAAGWSFAAVLIAAEIASKLVILAWVL